jgi:branched-chain amino acid transport system substrate-binding protein
MDIVVASAKKYSPGVPQENRLIRTIQAWGNALVLWEALIRADKAGALTGQGIMEKGFRS